MKRRTFGLLTGTSLIALQFGNAYAQAAKRDASLLKSTLTPLGGERAGNADGSIPAWTGGFTTTPAGWQAGDYMPDPFADEAPILVIDSSNVDQHADRLSEGVVVLIKKIGFSIKVYPTHRTALASQDVYDNTATNAVNAQLDPAGGRFGFTDAFGGIPFPIPDVDDPAAAGAEIIWNHNSRWIGYAQNVVYQTYNSYGGQFPTLAADINNTIYCPYYGKGGSFASFDGLQFKQLSAFVNPPNIAGEQVLAWYSTNPYSQPNQAWELLNGQGRVREAPEISFDTPNSFLGGITTYEETWIFTGSLQKYDWKCLGKKEMYIPYNNNGIHALPYTEALMQHFVNPDHLRWELHRVWVVDATLHPGERNVLPHRRFYVDEDIWTIGLGDSWDANGNLYKVAYNLNLIRPDMPGTLYSATVVHDLQTSNWTWQTGTFDQAKDATLKFYDTLPQSTFNPQQMAASAQY